MKKVLTILLVAAIALPVSLLANPRGEGRRHAGPGHPQCQGPQMGRADGPGMGRLLALSEELGLTDEQKDQLEQMMLDFQLEQVDRKAELKKARMRLRALKHDPEAPQQEVMRGIDGAASLRADMQKQRFLHRKAVQNVLTDVQKDKLKELRLEKRKGMREFGERRFMEDRPNRGYRGQGR